MILALSTLYLTGEATKKGGKSKCSTHLPGIKKYKIIFLSKS